VSVYTGFLKKINEKTGRGKRGPWILYSGKIEKEDGTEYDDWISFGFDKPSVKEGDYVTITTKEDAKGYQKVETVEQHKNAPAKAGAAVASRAGSNVAAPSGGKERSIHYQSARKDAITMLECLISIDALPITSAKTKAGEAKRYEELMDLVDKLTVRYYNDTETQRILETVADEGANEEDISPVPDAEQATDESDE
jgi:hypothetical protein